MKERVLAFLISNGEENQPHKKAVAHLAKLAEEFNKSTSSIKLGDFKISLCYEGDLDKLLVKNKDSFEFCVGPYLGQYHSGYEASENNLKNIRDRFLKVKIEKEKITIINDCAGTIPVYYSTRNHISLSNIEPTVILDSAASYSDVNPANIYGFLRYSHFIWDETFYKHIFTQEPDSLFIYNTKQSQPSKKYLKTVKSSQERINLNDKEVADELYELNRLLVHQALKNEEEIILPLSAGYDSRMIFAAISELPDLKNKLKCFTYGPNGSIDVESAKRLCKNYGINWNKVSIPCHFLEKKYLNQIALIFGSSFHPHGMYQLEFLDEIKSYISDKTVITSGFMTGVPAGQHNFVLKINSANHLLTEAMNKFSQSKCWDDNSLLNISKKFDKSMLNLAELRFKKAFERFDGEVFQKAVVFDIWTRQRNFIAYHPRTLEWKIPFLSPHMGPEYQNFFMSLSEKHLSGRYAVELMFKRHYNKAAKIISNSNGIKPIEKSAETYFFEISKLCEKITNKLGLSFLIPNAYRNIPISLDIPALQHSKKEGLFPIFSLNKNGQNFLSEYFSAEILNSLYQQAENGSIKNYQRLVFIQAIANGLFFIDKQ